MLHDPYDYEDEVFEEDRARMSEYMQEIISEYIENMKAMQASIITLEQKVEALENKK